MLLTNLDGWQYGIWSRRLGVVAVENGGAGGRRSMCYMGYMVYMGLEGWQHGIWSRRLGVVAG